MIFLAVCYSSLVLPFSANFSTSSPNCVSQTLLSSLALHLTSLFFILYSSCYLFFLHSDFVLCILSWIICCWSVAFQVFSLGHCLFFFFAWPRTFSAVSLGMRMSRNDNILARKRQILVNESIHFFTFAGFHRLVILSFRSEHERHCPDCSFVRGDHTKNVPMSGGSIKAFWKQS